MYDAINLIQLLIENLENAIYLNRNKVVVAIAINLLNAR